MTPSCPVLDDYMILIWFLSISGWPVDTPDPYLILRIKTAPEGRRRTTTKDNQVNPVWNEEFEFFLDNEVENKLRMYRKYIDSKYIYTQFIVLRSETDAGIQVGGGGWGGG